MKIEQLFQEAFDNTERLEIMDMPSGPLRTTLDGEPVRFLYRSVSKDEYEAIMSSGVIEPSQFYGRIHAAAIPTGGDVGVYKILKIKYEPSDGWKAKRASTGVFATTYQSIPVSRIVETLPRSELPVTYTTEFRQYSEYQTR